MNGIRVDLAHESRIFGLPGTTAGHRETGHSRRWSTQSVTSEGRHEASECSAVVDMMCGRCANAPDV